MTDAAIETLDLRDLPPPRPLERVLSLAAARPAGERFAVLLIHEPFPLYDFLAARGYGWRGEAVEGGYRLVITV